MPKKNKKTTQTINNTPKVQEVNYQDLFWIISDKINHFDDISRFNKFKGFIEKHNIKDINKILYKGKISLLQWAISHSQKEIAKYLISLGADINYISDGMTPLHWAIYLQNDELIKLLINNGADLINLKDPFGNTSLESLLIELTAPGAKDSFIQSMLSFIQTFSKNGESLLITAIKAGKADIVEILLKNYKANVTLPNLSTNETPLVIAKKLGNKKIINLIESYCLAHHIIQGDDKESSELINKHTVNIKNEDNNTALHLAVIYNRTNLIDNLIQNVADLNALNKEKQTPLDIALKNGNQGIINSLLKASFVAYVQNNNLERVDQLLSNKQFNLKNSTINSTCLEIAIKNGNAKMVETLIYKGETNVNTKINGSTPLQIAKKYGNQDIIRILTIAEKMIYVTSTGRVRYLNKVMNAESFNVNMQNQNTGETILHRAAKEGKFAWVQLLVSKGADLTIKDFNGKTAYDAAIYANNIEIAQYLANANNKGPRLVRSATTSETTKSDIYKLEVQGFRARSNSHENRYKKDHKEIFKKIR